MNKWILPGEKPKNAWGASSGKNKMKGKGGAVFTAMMMDSSSDEEDKKKVQFSRKNKSDLVRRNSDNEDEIETDLRDIEEDEFFEVEDQSEEDYDEEDEVGGEELQLPIIYHRNNDSKMSLEEGDAVHENSQPQASTDNADDDYASSLNNKKMPSNSGNHGPSFYSWRSRFAEHGLSLKIAHGQKRWFKHQDFKKC